MQLKFKSFNQIIQDMSAALQGATTALVDVSVGSVIRALFEANAGLVLWLQWLVLQVLNMTRASTSVGADLDSWMADFGLSRLPAMPATGVVTLSRYASGAATSVPFGTVLKTIDGAMSFTVGADDTLSNWQAGNASYIFPVGVSSIDVPVRSLTAGVAGNVLANTITVIASSLPGVDQVTNAVALVNGLDTEADDAFRRRFQAYLASLAKATLTAVNAAISGARQGLSFKVRENVLPNGEPRQGTFLVVVDDGSGDPSNELLAAVADAVEAVRPIGTVLYVIGPTVVTANVSVTVSFGGIIDPPSVQAIQQWITGYINVQPIEGSISVTRVAQCVYSNCSAVQNVTNILINGASCDLASLPGTVFRAGQIAVTVNAG